MSYVHFLSERSSWHSMLTFTRNGSVLTRCGRLVPGPDQRLSDSLPMGEKSCETCWRLLAHDGEVEATEPTMGDPGDEPPSTEGTAG